MAQIIKANEEVIEVEPMNGKDFNLKEMQDIVGGYIEIARLGEGKIMILNEEGKLLGLDYNTIATEIYQTYYGLIDYIVGDVLVCEANQVK